MSRERLLEIPIAAGLLVQAVLLSDLLTGIPERVLAVAVGLLLPMALIAGVLLVSSYRVRRLDGGAVVLIAMQLVIGATGLVGIAGMRESPDSWVEDRRRELTPLLRDFQVTVPLLLDRIETLQETAGVSNRDSTDYFTILTDLRRSWQIDAAEQFPLALIYWRDGERIAWTGDPSPFPLDGLPDEAFLPLVVQGVDAWCWRSGWPWRDGYLEWQIRLAAIGGDTWRRPAPGDPHEKYTARTSVVFGNEPQRGEWLGTARYGISSSVDVALDTATGDMELPFLRLTVASQSWTSQLRLQRIGSRTIQSVALAVGMIGFGVWTGIWWMTIVTLLFGRVFLVIIDLAGMISSSLVAGSLSPPPNSLSSILDPVYFSSVWGWGLMSTVLDALLSMAVLAVCIVATIIRLHPARRLQTIPGRWPWRALLLGLISGALMLALHEVATEIVTNANSRLVGSRIPLNSWSFWLLHLTLLLGGGAALSTVASLAVQLRARKSLIAYLAVIAGTLLASAVPGVELTASARLFMPLTVLLIWWGTELLPSPDTLLRGLGWFLPLLLSIIWTHAALLQEYEVVRRAWLERKAEEITGPREDWVSYLIEDLLTDMAGLEVNLKNSPEAHSLDADQLWNNWRASELWLRAGAADLGLSGEVEIIDEQGMTSSLYSAGFFRDLGYELVQRSDWEEGPTVMPRIGLESMIYLQREQRRFASGDEWVLRGEIPQLDTSGWISLTLPIRSGRISTLSRRFDEITNPDRSSYSPRVDLDRPLVLMRGDENGWLDTGGSDLPAAQSRAVIGSLRSGAVEWGRVRIGDNDFLCTWRGVEDPDEPNGEGFLLGILEEGFAERLLDLSRLILLDLLLLTTLALPVLIGRWLSGRSVINRLGFQERFLAIYLVIGMLPLLLAGMFIDRLSREWLVDGAKTETREGLDTAREQLQGLLAEQARALAGSEYIAELLETRMAGRRPMGPYSARQAMVFTADGRMLLDETLSDLDDAEAALLLQTAKRNALILIQDAGGIYLGTVIPVDLTGVPDLADMEGLPTPISGPTRRERDGYFFYRQRIDTDLMSGLGEVIKGEAALHIAGEVVMASHPGNVFSGRANLLMTPSVARQLQRNPGNTFLLPLSSQRLAWTGMLTLPMLRNTQPGSVLKQSQPAVMSVIFPARERDYVRQRDRTLLFLAGLATLIFLTATLLGLALTWKIFDPVRVLVDATRRLASGDFDAPVPEAGRDELGTLSASFRAMRDDLRSTQRTLAESERFLARVLEGVPVGVAVLDVAHNVVSLNPAARRMVDVHFGAGAGEPDDRVRLLLAGFDRAIDGIAGEAELVSPDGSRTLRGRLAPLHLPDGRTHTMIVCEDVTEFLRTKKMAINAQLARQVAHEVKNPLTPIQLSIQFLQQAWRDQAENMDEIITSTISQVLEQVELLRRIATEFSLLGRPEEISCRELDFRLVVKSVVDRYVGPEGPDSAHPTVQQVNRELPLILAHEDSLAKVIANLMENSLQAAVEDRALIVDIDWRIEADSLTLLWQDNGSGLSSEVAKRLFDPYFSTKTQGTGLGLPICRSLLAGMGGTIALRNRSGQTGAVAEVSLPLAKSDTSD